MSIYDDHIRLWNEGVLPENYTVETLLSKHTSIPRNPKMAQVFYRAGFIEAWGRGYEKIMTAFDKAHLKRPVFTVEQGGFTATVYREIFMSVRGDAKPKQTDTEPMQTERSTQKTTQKTTQKILDLIALNPYITRNEMAIECAVTPDAIKLQLKNLKEKGVIRRVGADRGGYWEIINRS